jgi:hypothetical protein
MTIEKTLTTHLPKVKRGESFTVTYHNLPSVRSVLSKVTKQRKSKVYFKTQTIASNKMLVTRSK